MPIIPPNMRSTYRVNVIVKASDMNRVIIAGADTCYSKNLLRADAVPESVQISSCSQPRLQSATCGGLHVLGIVMMPLIIGDVEALPMYAVENLPISILLGTPLLDFSVDELSPQTSSIRLITGHRIALIDLGWKAACV